MKRKRTDGACSGTTDSASSVDNPQGYAYEVFLSFRGSDTRKGFADHLYTSLTSAGIRTCRDNEELRVGEDIGGNLLEAIDQSKIFIPIFSKNYATSKWCLQEAAHMVKCKNNRNRLVLPIFYDVMPHEVRQQSGTYEEAFGVHSKHNDEKTIQEWRKALEEIGALKGWESKNFADGHEGELVKKVVLKVWGELQKAHLIVKDSMVRLEDSIEKVMGMLQVGSNDVRVVGLCGIGGIGKTTLAKIIYNKILEHFECSSFLKDVREMSSQPKGLEKLQTQLVSDILRSKDLQREFANVDDGIKVLRERFRDKKVLILLDDVDNKDQINALAANLNWFAGGSRIIITTRDKDVLDVCREEEIYEVRSMHFDEALLLFNMHAFKRESPATDYVDLSEKIVNTTGGLPLALEVIGSFLFAKHKEEWEETFEKLLYCPFEDVLKKLRISYDALNFWQQQIFLDIACFFIGTDKRIAIYMWQHCKFFPKMGLDVLLQRSLVKIGDDHKFWMHDQLRDLGREIVRNENIRKPGKRSRLWSSEDVSHVLQNQEGFKKVEAIQFDDRIKSEDYCFTTEQPMDIPNIRFLGLVGDEFASRIRCRGKLSWLQWRHCAVRECRLFLDNNLVILDLSYSNITDEWCGWSSKQLGTKLKVLILEFCQDLCKTPDLSKFQSLERLSFKGCENLQSLPNLSKSRRLKELNLYCCEALRELQGLEELESLEHLDIGWCKAIENLPNLSKLRKLKELILSWCEALKELQGLEELESLEHLDLGWCRAIENLPNLSKLRKLKKLNFDGCEALRVLQGLEELKSLERVDINSCPSLHYCFEKWPHISWHYNPRRTSFPIHLLKYKVFLSLQGWDLLYDHLYISHDRSTFIDGKEIGADQVEAINQSKISIPIFSKGYAFSTQYLRELAHIVESKKKRNQSILPIFFDVSPDQVQKQFGSYEEAFEQHMRCYDAKIVEVWRTALREVGTMDGWELQHLNDEFKATTIVNALHNVSKEMPCGHEVRIEAHVKEVMKLLEIDGGSDVRVVGVSGKAGIGKTALAKVIYNHLKGRFVYHSFLADVREISLQNRGLEELQSQLLLDIVRPNNPREFKFTNVDGVNLLKQVNKKVLIVVDDVDQRDQLNALVPHNGLFASGSKIIIVTRNKEALDVCQVGGIHELNELQFSDALVLFQKHSFKKHAFGRRKSSPPNLISLSRQVVSLIGGFPLVLEVIGSFLCNQDENKWEYMLKELRKIPHNDVQSKLKKIYEQLNDNVQEAFLDVACFLSGMDMSVVHCMFGGGINYGAEHIKELCRISLVKVLDNNESWMHDELRDLGREIVQWQNYNAPYKGIRLWCSEEAIEVLNKKQNTERIEAICLNGTGLEGCCFRSDQFRLLPKLRFLQLDRANIAGDFSLLLSNLKWLQWNHCPNELLATNLWLKELLVLDLSYSDIVDDWIGWSLMKGSINLKALILKSCQRLTKTPDFSTFPELDTLILDDCISLNYIDPSIRSVKSLRLLSVKGCSGLEILPQELTFLERLAELYIDGTSVKEIPTLNDQIHLKRLSLSRCKSLTKLPSNIGRFRWLMELDFSYASIDALPDSIGDIYYLKVLNMFRSNIGSLPRTLGKLKFLEVIDVSYCRNLNGEVILEPMRLYSLRAFKMEGTNITLPPSITGLLRLRGLDWIGCYEPPIVTGL